MLESINAEVRLSVFEGLYYVSGAGLGEFKLLFFTSVIVPRIIYPLLYSRNFYGAICVKSRISRSLNNYTVYIEAVDQSVNQTKSLLSIYRIYKHVGVRQTFR